MEAHLPRSEVARIKGKYRDLPDLYWHNNTAASITPEKYEATVVSQDEPGITLWELCSGSGALSAEARERRVSHLPPVDMRYQWYLG